MFIGHKRFKRNTVILGVLMYFHRELTNRKKAREDDEERRRAAILAERRARIQDVTYRYQRGQTGQSKPQQQQNGQPNRLIRQRECIMMLGFFVTSAYLNFSNGVLVGLVSSLIETVKGDFHSRAPQALIYARFHLQNYISTHLKVG